MRTRRKKSNKDDEDGEKDKSWTCPLHRREEKDWKRKENDGQNEGMRDGGRERAMRRERKKNRNNERWTTNEGWRSRINGNEEDKGR